MAEQTLEQELQARIFIHKVAIASGVLMKEYIEKEREGVIKLPVSTLRDMADSYSNQVIQKAMADGTFEDLYKQAWDKAVINMPEYMTVM